MSPVLIDTLRYAAGAIAGIAIGLGFGTVQKLALRRNQLRQESGELRTGWAVMPGSMRRIAALLVALLVIQIFCPMLFMDGVQWWVSGWLLAGYGAMLLRQLRQIQSQ